MIIDTRIGIDKITLTNFCIEEIYDMEELSQMNNVTLEQHGVKYDCPGSGKQFHFLKIENNDKFLTLSAGAKDIKGYNKTIEYETLELTVGNVLDDNTVNLQLSEYKAYIENYLVTYIRCKYGIGLSFEYAEIQKLEINTTLELYYNFPSYHRIFRSMMFLLPHTFKKIGTYSSKGDSKEIPETYFSGNKRWNVRIYDKTKEMEDTKKSH